MSSEVISSEDTSKTLPEAPSEGTTEKHGAVFNLISNGFQYNSMDNIIKTNADIRKIYKK